MVASAAGGRRARCAALRDGVALDDGPTAPARVRRLAADTLELTIHEGRKRQVKRMCEHVGHPVSPLERIAFGPLELGDLAPGAYRRLDAAEVGRSLASCLRSGCCGVSRRPGRHDLAAGRCTSSSSWLKRVACSTTTSRASAAPAATRSWPRS